MKSAVLIAFLLPALLLRAQDYHHWISFGQQAMEEGDHEGAVHYYGNAFDLDSSKQELQYNYAQALRKAHYYPEALRLYLKIYSKGRGRFYPEGPAHIAQIKMYLGDYESALEFWKRANRRTEDDNQKLKIEQRMRSCSYALSNPLVDEKIDLVRMGAEVNSADSEFGIEVIADSLLLFSSLRGESNRYAELLKPEAYHARIYSSELSRYGLLDADSFLIPISQESVHLSNPCLAKDGISLYLSVQDEEGRSAISYFDLNSHSSFYGIRPLPEPVNQAGSNSSQAFFYAENERTYLLFSSDRDGGYGGWDLYITELDSDNPTVTNLGPRINSPGNEVTPFFDLEYQTLFFSSDWHEGYGGYDIFSAASSDSDTLSYPINLGLPINSPVNDLYYKQRASTRYMSSNRKGSINSDHNNCCSDIYTIKARDDEEIVILSDSIPSSIQSVEELAGLLPITLYFHNDIPDPGSQSNTSDVIYSTTAIEYLEMKQEYLNRYSADLDSSASIDAAESMDKFFEDEVKAEFNELSAVTALLLKELEKGKKLELAIKGYASPLAQSDYNRKLTQRRIMSVTNYLLDYSDGSFSSYMNSDNPSLKIIEIPYGESESSSYVSDNPLDMKGSIYSIAAARERKVEILKIKEW